jgi:hypothetical protein
MKPSTPVETNGVDGFFTPFEAVKKKPLASPPAR